MIASFFAASFGIIVMIFASPLLVRRRVQVRSGGDLLDHAARPARRLDDGARLAAEGRRDDDVRAAARRGRHRRQQRHAALHVRLRRTERSRRTGRARDGRVRRRRLPAQRQPDEGDRRRRRKVRFRDMRPSRAELKQAFFPMVRGTLVGTLFGAMPGTGPTITTFIAYALERKIAQAPGALRPRRDRGRGRARRPRRIRRRRSTSSRR